MSIPVPSAPAHKKMKKKQALKAAALDTITSQPASAIVWTSPLGAAYYPPSPPKPLMLGRSPNLPLMPRPTAGGLQVDATPPSRSEADMSRLPGPAPPEPLEQEVEDTIECSNESILSDAEIIDLPPEIVDERVAPVAEVDSSRRGETHPQVSNLPSISKHPKHCYPDGTFNFRVENMLYCIHHHVIRMSSVLTHLVCDDTYAVKPSLSLDVKSVELDALLDFIYTPFYAINRLPSESYRLALPLCVKWGFDELRDAILTKLEGTLELVERFTLARELQISEWEKGCLAELITRPTGLTPDEGRRLGLEAVIFISGLREDARTRTQCLHTCVSCDAKKRLSGGSVDRCFIQSRVEEWLAKGSE